MNIARHNDRDIKVLALIVYWRDVCVRIATQYLRMGLRSILGIDAIVFMPARVLLMASIRPLAARK